MKTLVGLLVAGTCVVTSPAIHAQEIAIGVPMALTGPYAFVGVPVRNGIMLALEEADAKGVLGAKLRIILEDTASEKSQAISLTNRLATIDRVLMMLGPTSSIEGTAAAPVANSLKMPMFTSAVSEDVLKAGPWSYKVTSAPRDIMTELGKYAVEELNVKKAVFVFNRDNDGFVAQKNAVRDVMKAAGVQIIGEEGILGSDADFTALATKLANSGADAVFVGSPAEQGASIVIQARQAGLGEKTTILAPPSMASASFLKTGGKAVEGVVFVADYFADSDSPQNKSFAEAYQARYKDKPDNWAAVGYTLGSLAVLVIKTAGPGADREKVRAAFSNLRNVPTVLGSGTYSLDENRAPHYGAAIMKVSEGRFVRAK
jgi:branched-chain amino acid transport system substrate-binding protein